MSLVGSIFGAPNQDDSKTKGELSSLFDKSSSLPERPHHVAPPPRKRKERPEPAKKERKKPKAIPVEEKEEKLEEKEERTVFVGNLPATFSKTDLVSTFRECGKIISTRFRNVPVTSVKLPQERAGDQDLMRKVCANTKQVDESKNQIAYVVFETEEAVEKALQLNNAEIAGTRIRVDRAKPTMDASRSVFVGNLPYDADEASLQEHFVSGCEFQIEDVVGVRIVRDKETRQCKGFGYVLFQDKTMVAEALKLHESRYRKRTIRVMVCGKRFKGRRGETEPPARAGAEKRIAKKALKTRPRGKPSKTTKSGVSKRAAANAKVGKRIKKLEKRISKGMGKGKK